MKNKANVFKVMVDGHKHERSHWVWCGFACLSCSFETAPFPGTCTKDEVMDREMNKTPPIAGDDKNLPAWWLAVMKNMVISSQKAQGLVVDGEPCELGIDKLDKQNEKPEKPGQEAEQKAFEEEKKEKPCGFLCKMKKSLSGAKEPVKAAAGKAPEVTKDAIAKNAKEKAALNDAKDEASAVRIATEAAGEAKRL
tara:strand:- start:65 stop:649 length:585 start_codon:yes stop_codon:yes gene_type:complete